MKEILSNTKYRAVFFKTMLLYLLCSIESSCKKLVEVDSPNTSVNADNIYLSDATATSVLTGIYSKLSNENANISGIPGLFFYAGLSSDELTLYNTSDPRYLPFYTNALSAQLTSASFWSWIYPYIFHANSAIEGLTSSSSLTPAVKKQLLGEAKFVRALCYFYLVNLYGDISISTTTDWKLNSLLSRQPQSEVWKLIITDLKDAEEMLSIDFLDADAITSSTSRVRPTKWAAAALLARAYLYTSDWLNSEIQASLVISNTSLFDTVSLNEVFIQNSKETIWQLQPTGSGVNSNTGEGKTFILPPSGPGGQYPVYLSNDIIDAFEDGDNRRTNWVDSTKVENIVYYYPFKYKIGRVNTSTQEYIMMLRIAEQYLIRAEARAKLNKLTDAQSDLNVIRTRAGLANTTALSESELIDAIIKERQVELFTESGHRWLDLKRIGSIDSVMSVITPQKGGTWDTNWQWYPIPLTEIQANPNLSQNLGY